MLQMIYPIAAKGRDAIDHHPQNELSSMPLISVIIPAYNAERTLAETLQSVLEQTIQEFEILVVDDGSGDRTPEIAQSFGDPRIQVLRGNRGGASQARNRGITAAQGEFLAFLDADDLWTADKLQSQLDALAATPGADVVYCWTNCIDVTGQFIRPGSHTLWSGDVYEPMLLDDFIGTSSNILLRRSALEKIGFFDETLKNAQDTDLWLRLAQQYQFAVVPKPKVLYRISQGSLSSNLLSLEKSNLCIIEKAFAIAPTNLQHIKPHTIANLYKYLAYKALDATPGRHDSHTIFSYLIQVIRTDPRMLLARVLYKGFLRLLIMTLLPAQIAQSLLNRMGQLANTSTFLGYRKTSLEIKNRHKKNSYAQPFQGTRPGGVPEQ
jgi:glycosyltransferase involved in cell wall biosynthesis